MLASLVALLLGTVLVLLRDAVEEVVTGVAELVHEAVLLRLGLVAVGGNGIAAYGVLGVLLLGLSLFL